VEYRTNWLPSMGCSEGLWAEPYSTNSLTFVGHCSANGYDYELLLLALLGLNFGVELDTHSAGVRVFATYIEGQYLVAFFGT